MSSTATAAASSLHQSDQLAVRLAPAAPQQAPPQPPQGSHATANQRPVEVPVRRRPKRPAIPRHPIPSMQEAFAESLAEVTSGTLAMKPKLHVDTPQIRRDRLLDQDKSDPPPDSLWRMRPAQNCHELRKLLAQIAFGVYLLLKGMANSDAQVVSILQGHIDEVDDFLKTAMEDLKLATQDLNTRLDYLKLPLGNLPAFEEMLEDREFRLRIVEGNVRIEHILSRTTTALTQTIDDVAEGIRSTKEFTAYLSVEENGEWRHRRPAEVTDIFEAMRGNAEGWLNAFADLEEKTNTLDLLISKLADMVTEMDRCAGEVSRRTRFSVKPFTSPEAAARPPQESRVSSIQSYDTTPPKSPESQVPQMPPRLSIRFSGLGDIMATSFLDGVNGQSMNAEQVLPSLLYTPPAEVDKQPQLESIAESATTPTSLEPTRLDAQLAEAPKGLKESDASTIKSNETAIKDANAAAESPSTSDSFPESLQITLDPTHGDAPGVKVSDSAETPGVPVTRETEPDQAGETMYILQPRTYTPQPPTPLPSPRVPETLKPMHYGETTPLPSPRVLETLRPVQYDDKTPASSASSPHPPETLRPTLYEDKTPLPSPRMAETLKPAQYEDPASRPAKSPRLYIPPIPPTEERSSLRTASPISSASRGSNSTARKSSTIVSPSDSVSSDRTMDSDLVSGAPKTRSSIRERVSLRTTPPDSIHVPSTGVAQHQRPVPSSRTQQTYRTYSGADPAQTNSMYSTHSGRSGRSGRSNGHSTHSGQSTERLPGVMYHDAMPSPANLSPMPPAGDYQDYSVPAFPSIIPSPLSDQQYFRPVQASPHSPLQQRPHTAGPASRPTHLRNAPSTMGMSMLSSVTTMSQDSKGQKTVKKKRSAFGWLKKAFTLDEDERIAYEQRRNAEARNLYYDTKSPQFLDGKRVR